MIKLDIANKHRKKYVAFALTPNNVEHIIASDTKAKLMKFLFCNASVFEDFYIFDGRGRIVNAYEYNNNINIQNIVKYGITTPYVEVQFV